MKKGKMLWEEFANIQSITIRKEEMICFNDVEKFQVNQNDYSARKLVSLLKKSRNLFALILMNICVKTIYIRVYPQKN